MNVSIDQEGCIGCGLCVALCPTVFCMEGNVAAVCGTLTKENEEDANEAAESCPVSVIAIG
ncbi:ferredoxin [Christensenellaceae bacterium OttesenSCG-928-K19]|nr:ferredoxin [Christensenellaceae bacterium OttesenSCG-928-K19]